MSMDFVLHPISVKELIALENTRMYANIIAYPIYWCPEIYNNPYTYPQHYWVWPRPDDESDVFVVENSQAKATEAFWRNR